MQNWNLWLVPVLPLIGSAINGIFGRHFSKTVVKSIALLFPGVSMVYAWYVALSAQLPVLESHGAWIRAGSFSVRYGFQLDQLSLLLMLIVTTIGFAIHVYATGYMEHEGGYYRFFSYLNLFMFFMLMLVLADNYLLMFVGWEGVGLASYLLIGFFFLRDSASAAGKKAFIVNRIGDFSFLIALFLLVKNFGTLTFSEVFEKAAQLPVETAGIGLLTIVGLCMLGGAAGKSAQIPLYVWLPDAMEGPTPVSALIHAATMVTAGVYMVARSHAIFDRAPTALLVVAIIGVLTAFFAATIGMVQHDIKRVLAYSTVSQLGFMFAAAGVAAYTAAMFHLMTHAFFKGLLFLAAGSVIHGLSGEQDMRKMGGLRKEMPWTFWTMTAGTFAIAGAPLFSGFFSKDMILFKTFTSPYGSKVFWGVLLLTAFMTSFYMFRQWFLTFFGEFRGTPAAAGHGHHDEKKGQEEHHHHGHAHESPMVMVLPLVFLAILSVVGGFIGTPGNNRIGQFLAPVFSEYSEGLPAATVSGMAGAEGHGAASEAAGEHTAAAAAEAEHEKALEHNLMYAAIGSFALGLFVAWFFYHRRPELPAIYANRMRGLYNTLSNKYYVDEFYGAAIVKPIVEGSTRILWRTIDAGLIDGTINETASAAKDVSNGFRRMQSGNIRSYAGWVAIGAAVVIAFMIWTAGAR
ncbi:MAG TPA: NADH-quinone oxidoreductase subunit L [Terriglobales bacterium]|nr:NADH-quinone oxidoreductase subunit L [Terriglobales bacterium]